MNFGITFSVILVVALHPAAGQEITDITIVSSAGFGVQAFNRGSLATVFCRGLVVNGMLSANGYPLSTELGGIQVRIGGTLAPILAVADLRGYQQVNLQVPFESTLDFDSILGATTYKIAVSQGLRRGATRASASGSASPGDFFVMPSGFAAVQHAADYSLVTPDHPAKPGEMLVAYLTGMEQTTPKAVTGYPSPFDPLAIVVQYQEPTRGLAFKVEVGTSNSPAEFVGLKPGLVGVYQVNFRVPEGVPGGHRML